MRRLAGAVLLVLSIASCAREVFTPEEAIAECRKDPTAQCCGSNDCAEGAVCDFSLLCGQGSDHQVGCAPATGDRQCHARCDAVHACLPGQTCQQVTLFPSSDAPNSFAICAAAP